MRVPPAPASRSAVQPGATPALPDSNITALLHEWSAGDAGALDRLLPMVYDDLRRLAVCYLDRERVGHTLQATAIVHELYVLMLNQKRVRWQNRSQFLAVAATMMRRFLVSHARKHCAEKRGGGAVALSLDDALGVPEMKDPGVVALDEALTLLAEFAPRQSQVIEIRFFGGLNIEETAAVLGISVSTVKDDWSLAKAWLFRQLYKA